MLLPVEPRVPPNLKVTTVDVPAHILAGQYFDLSYTVSNVGGGAVPETQGKWTDLFYLSRDPNLDTTNDIFLGSLDHIGALAAGASYTNLQSLRLPQGLTGAYYILVATDLPTQRTPRGTVYEGAKDNDNTSASPQPILIDLPPPADVVATNVIATSSGNSGASVHVTWTVLNQANEAALGQWTDAVYLSDDSIWDINDTLIGRVSAQWCAHEGSVLSGDA